MSEAEEQRGNGHAVIRPVILPVVASYLIIYGVVVGVASLLLLFSRFPFALPTLAVGALLVGVYFVIRGASAAWVWMTQSYLVTGTYVEIRKGWVQKTEERIVSNNISEARAVAPLPSRLFGVGAVVIDTNDGFRHVLSNVTRPMMIAESIGPKLRAGS